MIQAVKNTTEETHHAPCVQTRRIQAAQHHAQVMSVGSLHDLRGIAGRRHGYVNKPREPVEVPGGGSRFTGIILTPHPYRFFPRNRRGSEIARVCLIESRTGAQFIQAYRDRLPEVHRGLERVGGDFGQHVTVREVVAREAVLFRAEDQRGPAHCPQTGRQDGSRVGQKKHRLGRFAVRTCARSYNEHAGRDSLREGSGFARVLENFGGAHRGASLAPVGLIGRNHGEVPETEVGHRPGRRPDIERIARRDQNHVEPVALVRG